MKLLAVLFLVGLALTSAVPVPSNELSLDNADDLELLFDFALEAEDGDDIKTEIGEKLKETMDEILEKIKDAVDQGKVVRQDILDKLKEVREKMRELKVELGKKGREILDQIKDKAKDYWRRILDKLRPTESSRLAERNVGEEIRKSLKEAFDKALERVREMIENGKTVPDRWLDKLRDIKSKFKDGGSSMDQKVREMFENVSERYKDAFRKIMDRLGIQKSAIAFAEEDDEVKTELGKKLKEDLHEILQKIKDAVERGRGLKEETLEKLKELRQKMKDMRIEITDKAKELLQKIRERGRDYFKKILDRLGLEKSAAEPNTELGKKLQREFDEIAEKIKDAIDHGKNLKESYLEKLKEIREQLKDLKLDIGSKAKEILKNIKDKAKDYWSKLLEKLRPDSKRSVDEFDFLSADDDEDGPKTELGKKLQEHLDEILEKIKDAVEHGKKVKEDMMEKAKQIRDKLKEMKEDVGKKARDLMDKIKEAGKDYFKKLLENLGLGKRDLMSAEEEEVGVTLRKHLDELLEKIKDAVEHGKKVRDETLEKIKELRQKLKDAHEDIGAKARDILRQIREKSRDYLKKLLEKLGLNKRSIAMYSEELAAEDDGSDVISRIRDRYQELLQKIKDAIDNNKDLNIKDMAQKLKELRERLREKGGDLGEKVKEMIKNIREKMKDYFRNLLEKLRKDTRSVEGFREKLKELREKIRERFDPEAVKEKIESIFGRGNELADKLHKLIKDKGGKAKEKILDFIDRILEKREESKRDIKDLYNKLKDYLQKVKIELKEKFSKFGEWAVAQYEKGLEQGKDRAENLKKLAKNFIGDARVLSREVIDQAKEFFREYKDDLGTVYDDVVAKIKEIVKNRE